MLVRLIVVVAATAISLCAKADTSGNPLPCVGPVCLGMTLDEVAKLDLTPVGAGGLSFKSSFPGAVGIDTAGTRIKFAGSFFDRPAIEQLQKKVKTICSVNTPWLAHTKASDGRRIQLSLYPLLMDGKSQVTVVEIRRTIPKIMTGAQKKNYDDQLHEKYGSLYDSHIGGQSSLRRISNVTVYIDTDISEGNVIRLSMPANIYSTENTQRLMGQPGCTEKLKVD